MEVDMTSTFLDIAVTATNDLPFQLTTDPTIFFDDVNIHVYDNNCYYGMGVQQSGVAIAGDVLPFRNVRAMDVWFKNYTAGQNTRIAFVGTLLQVK
jgi:hypothetical protein